MTQQVINIGSAPDDGTGDPLRTSFDKTNDNFTELYAKGGTEGLWNFNQTSTDTSTAPVLGRFKTNSGNYRDATQIAIHAITIQGIDRSSTLRTLLVGDLVQCQDSTNPAAWCRYSLQSLPVDHGTWFQLNVTLHADSGVASGDNQEIVFVFTANSGGGGGGAYQPLDPTLTSLSNLVGEASTFPYFAAEDTFALDVVTPFARGSILSALNPTDARGKIDAAPLDSPTFTGNPQAPTPTAGDNDTSVATTAFTAARGVRNDILQTLTAAEKSRARANIDVLKKNYMINGAMMVSQENGSTAGTVIDYYPVDQFRLNDGNSGARTVAQVASRTPGGSPNRVRITVTTADAAVAAGDYSQFVTAIEGYRTADLNFGSAAAKTIILQFGVKAPAGTYCVGIRNHAINRTYIGEYVISAGEANIDVIKSVTIPGDQTGTWTVDNTRGLYIDWCLMVGTTSQTPAGVWTAGNFLGSANQFNFMGTAGNVFELFDVGLYEGSVAPTFQVPDYASELQTCQRYYEPIQFPNGLGQLFASWLLTSTFYYHYWQFHVAKRAVPTFGLGASATWTNAPTVYPTFDGVMFNNGTTFFYLSGAGNTIAAAANARL
jgi:hypothetical protein